jgi:hypothetical protein
MRNFRLKDGTQSIDFPDAAALAALALDEYPRRPMAKRE